jgi:uncharacterized Zn finger protein
MVAFREQPDLSAWQRLQTLAPAAGDDWPALREGLLTHAGHVLGDRNEYKEARGGALDVLLREERRAEALRAAVKSGDRVLLARAADAALLHLPEDVLRASRRVADEIMGGGQSAHYGRGRPVA